MSKMKYKILAPEDEVVYKDDGKRLVLLLTDTISPILHN